MNKVRIGVIGLGAAGSALADALIENKIKGAELSAVCDRPAATAEYRNKAANNVASFESLDCLLGSSQCDAVVIATPHRLHPEQAMAALDKGIHVFSEKPAGIECESVRKAVKAAEAASLKYGLNFNRRILPLYRKLHNLVTGGELGNLIRFNWTSTNWLRTQSYFDVSNWRGTWAGEGGGVLLNQCPHMLDMLQWICGMPEQVMAKVTFGGAHNIEVDDKVTALLDYGNGVTGIFEAGTGEFPGTNRIEIVGDRGRIVLEDKRLRFDRTDESVSDFIASVPAGFDSPKVIHETITCKQDPDIITSTLQNFVDSILDGKDLMVPASEGLKSLELANAMLLSSWQDSWIPIPFNKSLYNEELQKRINMSTPKKVVYEQKLNLLESLRLSS